MLYVPRHLPNKLEYKFVCCISVHYQSRMTSNGIANTPSRFHSAGRQGKMWEGGTRKHLGALLVLDVPRFGESFHAYTRFIRWTVSNSTVY
jgi:hypothetical protein